MPRHINLKNRGRRFTKRTNKSFKSIATDPIDASRLEQQNEQRNEAIQQEDIDKEIEIEKQDKTEIVNKANEMSIKKRMKDILRKLPKEDKLRKLLQEKDDEKNNNKLKSSIKINQ